MAEGSQPQVPGGPGLSQQPLETFLATMGPVLDALHDGITVRDAERGLVYANDPAARACGFEDAKAMLEATPGQILNKFRILDEEGTPLGSDQLPGRRVFDGQPAGTRLLQYEHLSTGDRRWAEVQATPLRTEEGAVTAVVNVIHDVTELKEKQKELEAAKARLEERVTTRTHEAERFRALTDQTTDAIFVIDPDDGSILYANKGAADNLGYEQDALLSLRVPEISVEIEDQEDWRRFVDRLAQAGEARIQTEHRRVDGETFPVEVNARFLREEQEAYIVAVVRDNTEQQRVEAELRASNQDLQQFAYIVSHDLQEPLRMVTSYLGLLTRRYSDALDEEAHEFIEYAVGGADRMRRLIQGLLAYSRVGTRGSPPEDVDMDQVLDEVLANLHVSIQETGAEVTHDPLPTVHADPGQMTQLFQNLVGNALKFHVPGTAPKIHLSAEEDEQGWTLNVEDNGIGIPEDQRDRLFQVFTQLHARDEFEGTGIGLAVSKRVVDRHGGEIDLESTPGEGSTFHVWLPKPQPDPANAEELDQVLRS